METKNIYTKLLEAQKKIGSIKKDKTNPFFKSKYADINAYIDEVKPVLNECGLIILQPLVVKKGENFINTLIIDGETGEKVDSLVKLPDNPDPQKMGSVITYFRRYAIQSMLFLQAEDDDANKAANKAQEVNPAASTIPKRGVRLKEGVEYKLENEPKRPITQGVPTVQDGAPF